MAAGRRETFCGWPRSLIGRPRCGTAHIGYAWHMSIFDEKRADLEQHEFMMGVERGRLAVALDLLTDSLIMVGQHGVYCASSRNPEKPALDLQAVLAGMEGAKELIQSVMEQLRAQREAGRAESPSAG
jgi:hypothetical protein